MGFDFLPDIEQEQEQQSTAEENSTFGGGSYGSSLHHFFDGYRNHRDLRAIRSVPPVMSEYKYPDNFEWVNERYSPSSLIERIARGDKWFGAGTTYQELLAGYTKFQKPGVLEEARKQVQNELPEELKSSIQKKKTRFNALGLGVFSFDKAAGGMFATYDYFDKETGEKIDSNFVVKRSGKFFHTESDKELDQKKRIGDNGLPVINSSIKESYVDFEKKNVMENAVEIFINVSVVYNVKIDQFVYNGLSGLILAEFLIQKGFKVKINALYGIEHVESHDYFHHILPAKGWSDTLDMQALAYITSDPRFYRYEVFKAIIAGYDVKDYRSPDDGLGIVVQGPSKIRNIYEQYYFPNTTKPVAETNIFIGGAESLEDCKEELKEATKILIDRYGKE